MTLDTKEGRRLEAALASAPKDPLGVRWHNARAALGAWFLDHAAELLAAAEERDEARAALQKISDIRDSIVGAQTVNWSEHVYPLAAALDAAGFKGVGHKIARENVGTLISQFAAAESRVVELEKELQGYRERGVMNMGQYHAAFKRADAAEFRVADLEKERDALREVARSTLGRLDQITEWSGGYEDWGVTEIADGVRAALSRLDAASGGDT